MLINNYYCGCTGKVTGFVVDTAKKTFKRYSFVGDEYRETKVTVDGRVHEILKPGYRDAGDIQYYFPTKGDMEHQLLTYMRLGFMEDDSAKLDFGIFVK